MLTVLSILVLFHLFILRVSGGVADLNAIEMVTQGE